MSNMEASQYLQPASLTPFKMAQKLMSLYEFHHQRDERVEINHHLVVDLTYASEVNLWDAYHVVLIDILKTRDPQRAIALIDNDRAEYNHFKPSYEKKIEMALKGLER